MVMSQNAVRDDHCHVVGYDYLAGLVSWLDLYRTLFQIRKTVLINHAGAGGCVKFALT
jgi:hypothetical protein